MIININIFCGPKNPIYTHCKALEIRNVTYDQQWEESGKTNLLLHISMVHEELADTV